MSPTGCRRPRTGSGSGCGSTGPAGSSSTAGMPFPRLPRRRDLAMKLAQLLIFGAVGVAAWFLAIYFWPRLLLSVFKRAILVKGFGDGPIPVNSLYVESQTLFAHPLGATTGSKLATTGV